MSEAGGRADKDGNEYENQQLAWLLLDLVEGKISSVTVEPLGKFHNSVEYTVEKPDGIRDYYQCKSGNGGRDSWNVVSLQSSHEVFSRIREIMDSDPRAHYHFLSPLSFRGLDELCNRARTNESAEEWVTYQLTNKAIREAFENCAEAFGLNHADAQDAKCLRSLLSRCYFEQMPFTETATRRLEMCANALFTGDAQAVRILLENYANGVKKHGVKLTAPLIIKVCDDAGFLLRRDLGHGKTLGRINTLNSVYWPECPWIHGTPLPRKASEEALREIEAGRSVILHGKAGVGKSGCLQEILNNLKEKGVLYLSVKLDKLVPQKSADCFGQDLGLPQSPIYALSHLAGGKPCVLILDQLDALRWTSPYSGLALDVCKEMISHAEAVNGHMGGKLSIVFATRTFDLEQDSGLQSLFEAKQGEKCENSLTWRKIQVNPFDEAEIVRVIGEEYRNFSPRLKNLLQIPSSLYVWTQIRKENRIDITSAGGLMDAWWKQILNAAGNLRQNIRVCKDEIVRRMETMSSFSITLRLFSESEREIDFLVSSGIMDNRNGNVSFVHQSFLDYFISQKLLEDVYDGKNLAELLASREEQTPNVRYRLLTVLQELAETDQPTFTRQARNILSSPSVRYYLQCCVFEAAGQLEEPSKDTLALTREYANLSQWREYVLRTSYWGHPIFVRDFLSASSNEWTDATLSLLRSVAVQDSAFVETVLRRLWEKHPEKSRELWDALPYDCTEDGEELFRLRMELLEENPDLLDKHIAFYHCIQNQSARAVDYLELVLRNWETQRFSDIYLGEEHQLTQYAERHYKLITNRLFPLICELTREYQPNYWNWILFYDKFKDWLSFSSEAAFYRRTVTLAAAALKKYVEAEGEAFCLFLSKVSYPLSGIGHKIVMDGLSALSTEYSDFTVSWLLSGFREKAFVYSSVQQDYLYHAGILIRRFSPYCSQPLFERLEQSICKWIDDKKWVKDCLKHRLNTLRNGNVFLEYFPYWGGFQKTLLPCLDSSRLSQYGQELLRVLERNPHIPTPFYHGFFGSGKTVVSPVDSYAERLSGVFPNKRKK